jgi:anti-anti-sigma regulatory factor
LSGRPKGEKILKDLLAHLTRYPVGARIPLDFTGVKFLDISCADEFLNRLLLRLRSGEIEERFLIIRGVNPSVRETIDAVLRLRGLVILCEGEDGFSLLGEIKQPVQEALAILMQRKRLTSADLARELKKTLTSACNRLTLLQKMGLAYRVKEEGIAGRQYYYESIL